MTDQIICDISYMEAFSQRLGPWDYPSETLPCTSSILTAKMPDIWNYNHLLGSMISKITCLHDYHHITDQCIIHEGTKNIHIITHIYIYIHMINMVI